MVVTSLALVRVTTEVVIDLGNVVLPHGELLQLYGHLDFEILFLVGLGASTPLADLELNVGMVPARAGSLCHIVNAVGRAIASQASQGLKRDLLFDALRVGAHRLFREVLALVSHLGVAITIAELLASQDTVSVKRDLPLETERVHTSTIAVTALPALSSLVDLGDGELIIAQKEQVLLVLRTAYLHQLMHIGSIAAPWRPTTLLLLPLNVEELLAVQFPLREERARRDYLGVLRDHELAHHAILNQEHLVAAFFHQLVC